MWVAVDRRRIRKVFPTYAAARSWRASTMQAVREGRRRGPSGVRFRTAAEEWLRDAAEGTVTTRGGARYKPSVIHSYGASLNHRVLPALGGYPLDRITRGMLQGLVDRWAADGLSPSSIRNTVTAIRVVFRRAVRRGSIAVDPVAGLELPGVRGRRDRVADPWEVPRLLAALPDDDRPVWATAFMAGLRAGELRALSWDDVDLAGGVIRVRRSWCDRTKQMVGPKSTAGLRAVPMTGRLRDELTEWRMRSGRTSGLVFGPDPDTPRGYVTTGARARKAWKAAGLQPLGLHEARHSAVSMWVHAGLNVRLVSTYAGHASVAFTLQRYAWLFEGQEREAAAVLDAYLERTDTAGRLAAIDGD